MHHIVPSTPFHSGELEVQRCTGVAVQVADTGRRRVRCYLLQQHQDFYNTQHQLLLAFVDNEARPWVAMVAGAPGFVSAINPMRLRVDALPLAGPPNRQSDVRLAVGEQVGVLGIDYSNRRRNRVNGRIVAIDSAGFEIQVVQSFGNYPKYIQIRETHRPPGDAWRAQPTPGAAVVTLSPDMRALTRRPIISISPRTTIDSTIKRATVPMFHTAAASRDSYGLTMTAHWCFQAFLAIACSIRSVTSKRTARPRYCLSTSNPLRCCR